MNIKKVKKVKLKLETTWETYEKIEEQYFDDSNVIEKHGVIYNYLNNLPIFEKQVFFLYVEFCNLRQVAKETNVSRSIIADIVNKIKKDVTQLK